ncbi:hypothetical protein AB1N83_003451 [Pleurotus pulmonarius]
MKGFRIWDAGGARSRHNTKGHLRRALRGAGRYHSDLRLNECERMNHFVAMGQCDNNEEDLQRFNYSRLKLCWSARAIPICPILVVPESPGMADTRPHDADILSKRDKCADSLPISSSHRLYPPAVALRRLWRAYEYPLRASFDLSKLIYCATSALSHRQDTGHIKGRFWPLRLRWALETLLFGFPYLRRPISPTSSTTHATSPCAYPTTPGLTKGWHLPDSHMHRGIQGDSYERLHPPRQLVNGTHLPLSPMTYAKLRLSSPVSHIS